LVYCFLYTSLYLWQEGDITKIDPFVYAKFGMNGAFLLLTYLAIYIFEKLFGFLSDVTLAELSNSNNPLISKLAEITPGTFHHSIQVGNLAVEAAKKIGANPLLVYAGAMYHDIGKLEAPSIFTENQITGINPLDEIDFEHGAQLVISHIESGIKMARKNKLPQQIIDFIATHQGTTKTKYFYNSFANKYPDKIIDISLFTYPGPIPFTKETAILMMADATEASSRSLSSFSDDAIDKLVENIINDQMEQGQFNNAPITLKEISDVKEVFKRRLKIIYHSRIKYPEIIKK
jgi:putative nucleotidyltransferase with HDIG domain